MAISLDEIKAALDSFAAASMAAAGVPPIAVGQEGIMLATGAMDYIKGMFANAESALASQIGLAEVDASLQQANLQAAIEREKIALGYAELAVQREYQQGLLHVQHQQIGLQRGGLKIYKSMLKKAKDIEDLTHNLIASKYLGKPGLLTDVGNYDVPSYDDLPNITDEKIDAILNQEFTPDLEYFDLGETTTPDVDTDIATDTGAETVEE